MKRLLPLFALSVLVGCGSTAPLQIATPSLGYKCIKAVAAAHDLPGAKGAPPPRCPKGEVPYPTQGLGLVPKSQWKQLIQEKKEQVKLTLAQGSSRSRMFARRYKDAFDTDVDPDPAPPACASLCHAGLSEFVDSGTAMLATITIYQPYVPSDGSHSLAEINAGDRPGTLGYALGKRHVEAGWIRSRYWGSLATRLFVYGTNNGYQGSPCYPGSRAGNCGWVQVSSVIKPGDILTSGLSIGFQVRKTYRGWEVYYGFYDVGYFPFSHYGGQWWSGWWYWYGEVAPSRKCTDMGNGLFASNPHAADFSYINHSDDGVWSGYPVGRADDPSHYSYVTVQRSPFKFRYGGGGWC